MKPLFPYTLYPTPRKCIYNHPTDKWCNQKNTWLEEEREATVLGETKHQYVTEILPIHDPTKLGGPLEYIYATGFHQSRLVRWLDMKVGAVINDIII